MGEYTAKPDLYAELAAMQRQIAEISQGLAGAWVPITKYGTNATAYDKTATTFPFPKARLDPGGVVRLAGLIGFTGSWTFGVLFTLPLGMRPSKAQELSPVGCYLNGPYSQVNVGIGGTGTFDPFRFLDGRVESFTTGCAIFLDGITFPLNSPS